MKDKIINSLLGVAIGDALGVPVEFSSRAERKQNPVTTMLEYGVHGQPIGTWSDDSALTFCLAESLTKGYDLVDIAKKCVAWKNEAYWSAHGDLFDIGIQTSQNLATTERIILTAENPLAELKALKGTGDEYQNGNGGLMRIMPLLLYIKGKPIKEQFDIIWEVSAFTHSHIRSAIACLIYLKLGEYILEGQDKLLAYQNTRTTIQQFFVDAEIIQSEREKFKNIIEKDIRHLAEKDIRSGGYVMESIEASLWCFITKDSYEAAVLKGINFGHDTDTTGAITGGLAGLYYGRGGTTGIFDIWVEQLVRKDDIIDLAERLFFN